jgi:hypothetical protein
MIELALLLGLGAVGYLLAVQNQAQTEGFTMSAPRPLDQHRDVVVNRQDSKGHSNQVPFFGAKVTQSMYSGANEHIMDNHTGAGKEYFQKRETASFFDAKPATGLPFGKQVETDFEQSRMVSAMRMANVFPIDQVQVGPGANDGYTNIPQGGFQQEQLRDFALPPTTDELRVLSKPKLTYTEEPVPGNYKITQPGIQAPVNKNKPDRFAVTGLDRANTAVGAQVASAIYPEQVMKEQARESTSVNYYGAGGGREGFWASYIRAFTEPFQEFMKLTAEGRPGPAGTQGNSSHIGAEMYSAQTKKDESVLSDATRFNVPVSAFTASAEHLGTYRYTEPLKQDVNVERNDSSILDAYRSNPYTQSLNSI